MLYQKCLQFNKLGIALHFNVFIILLFACIVPNFPLPFVLKFHFLINRTRQDDISSYMWPNTSGVRIRIVLDITYKLKMADATQDQTLQNEPPVSLERDYSNYNMKDLKSELKRRGHTINSTKKLDLVSNLTICSNSVYFTLVAIKHISARLMPIVCFQSSTLRNITVSLLFESSAAASYLNNANTYSDICRECCKSLKVVVIPFHVTSLISTLPHVCIAVNTVHMNNGLSLVLHMYKPHFHVRK